MTPSESFAKITELLKCNSSSGLVICGCSASDWLVHERLKKDRIGYIFRIEDDTGAFVRLMLSCLVELYWKPNAGEHVFLRRLEKRSNLPALSLAPILPEQLAALLLQNNPEPVDELFKPPAELSRSFILQLRWQRDAPAYQSGLDFFTRRPFDQRPVLQYVQVLFLESKQDNERKVFLMTSSTTLLSRLANTYQRPGPCLRVTFNANTQVMSLVFAISRRLLLDTVQFLQESLKQREEMV